MTERNVAVFEDWQIEAFVGKKFEYFKDRWTNKSKFNWAGFFFSGLWMLHRKMFKESMITMGAFLAVGLISEYALALDLWTPLGIGLACGIGWGGNDLYRSKLVRALKESDGMDQEAQGKYLTLQGGVNPIWKTALFFSIYFVFSIGLFVIVDSILF